MTPFDTPMDGLTTTCIFSSLTVPQKNRKMLIHDALTYLSKNGYFGHISDFGQISERILHLNFSNLLKEKQHKQQIYAVESPFIWLSNGSICLNLPLTGAKL